MNYVEYIEQKQVENPDLLFEIFATVRVVVTIIRPVDAMRKVIHIRFKRRMRKNWEEKIEKAIKHLKTTPINEIQKEWIDIHQKNNQDKTVDRKIIIKDLIRHMCFMEKSLIQKTIREEVEQLKRFSVNST
jgi:hypothetical protein